MQQSIVSYSIWLTELFPVLSQWTNQKVNDIIAGQKELKLCRNRTPFANVRAAVLTVCDQNWQVIKEFVASANDEIV